MAPCGSRRLGFGILANIRPSCTPYHAHEGRTKLETAGYAARVLVLHPLGGSRTRAGLQQRRGAPEPAMPGAASLTRSHRRAALSPWAPNPIAPTVTVGGWLASWARWGSTSPKVMRARVCSAAVNRSAASSSAHSITRTAWDRPG